MTRLALDAIIERERRAYLAARPKAQAMAQRAALHFPQAVPMHWMRDWPMPVPLYVAEAQRAELVDVDGHHYVDFCLGDTGAMFGHAPPTVVAAIAAQAARGITTMLPAAGVEQVGELLAERFALPWWQLTQTATDANRAVLRYARMITGRPRVLVFDHCYHGTVDETMVVMAPDGSTLPRPGQVGPVHDPRATTVVVEFNDLPAVERALARGDIACVLTEPVLTNAGMVLPEAGFLAGLRALCTQHDVPLIIDETHTLSSGLGGYARVHQLAPDFLVCGKAIAGGLPCAVYGYSEAMAARIRAAEQRRAAGHSGIGTTLAANALGLAALQASLITLHTVNNYQTMLNGAATLQRGLQALLDSLHLPWTVSRVGARLEFAPAPAPRTGRQSIAALQPLQQQAMHLSLLNRGFLLTPFHNMMLVSPVTTNEQINAFLHAAAAVLAECAAP